MNLLLQAVLASLLLGGQSVSVNVCAIGGKGDYLLRHEAEEKLRYLNAGLQTDTSGIWHGELAKHFGLEGKKIEPEAFKNLLQGFSPDGKQRLTQNAGSESRARGWEIVVSPHKSVSDLLAVLPLERWDEVLSCHKDAVKEVIRCIEDLCAVTRRGKGGEKQERADIIIGQHDHLTNRGNEPQVHSHLTEMNGCRREDGSYGAVVSVLLYTHQRLLNAVYQQTIARLLRERMGVVTELDRFAAKVRGVPETFIKATSSRSAEIEAVVGPQGSRSHRAADVAALTTRKEKDLKPVTVLAREWRKLAEEFRFKWKHVIRREPPTLTEKQKEEYIKKAIIRAAEGLVSEAPVFDKWQLYTRTVTNLIGKCIDYTAIINGVTKALAHPRDFDIVDLGTVKKEKGYTTLDHVRLEHRLLKELKALATDYRPLIRPKRLERILSKHPDLREEQRNAVALLADGGRLSVLTGFAGTGKTRTLTALREILEASFHERLAVRPLKVIGAAVSGRASDTLQTETGIPSMTLEKLLQDLRPTPLARVFREALRRVSVYNFKDFLRYAEAARRPSLKLDSRTTVVLDEASLAATKDLYELARRITKSGSRLVIVGDPAQLQAIGPSGGLDLIITRFRDRVAHLLTIQRQEATWEREAVKHIVQGKAGESLKAYEKEGRVTVKQDTKEARQAAVELYARGGGLTTPKDHLLLAHTNRDVRWLNHLAQALRLKAGLLQGRPLSTPDPAKEEGHEFYVGDRIQFLRNTIIAPQRKKEPLPERLLRTAVDPIRKQLAKRLPEWARDFVKPEEAVRVRNGQFGTVLAIHPKASLMYIELDTGERIILNAAKYRDLSLGYATSVFKSQSSTVNHVYALVGDRMTDRESAYVAASRGKLSTQFIVNGSLESPDLMTPDKRSNEQTMKELERQFTKSHKQVSAYLHWWQREGRKQSSPPQPPPEQEMGHDLGR